MSDEENADDDDNYTNVSVTRHKAFDVDEDESRTSVIIWAVRTDSWSSVIMDGHESATGVHFMGTVGTPGDRKYNIKVGNDENLVSTDIVRALARVLLAAADEADRMAKQPTPEKP